MLQPAVVIVISWLMVTIFIFCSLSFFTFSTIHKEVVNVDYHCYQNSDKTKNLKDTNSETLLSNNFFETNSKTFQVSTFVDRVTGINVQVVPIFPLPLLPAAAATALLGPSFGLLQVCHSFRIHCATLPNQHSHVPFVYRTYHLIQASTSSPIFPRLLFELLPTLGAATLGVLQGAILR